ncbi:MAG: hypothetical protein JRF63_11940 [Deltaproteobacteria bacterium]|nr:hypothetical protein [Deltaproteobacteria bacterium]
MIDAVKDKLLATGVELMRSPMVAKMMESEKVGIVMEKALTLPIKASETFRSQKERLTSLFELATQQDLDDLKRAVSRMEDLLRDIKRESGDLLRQTETDDQERPTVAE